MWKYYIVENDKLVDIGSPSFMGPHECVTYLDQNVAYKYDPAETQFAVAQSEDLWDVMVVCTEHSTAFDPGEIRCEKQALTKEEARKLAYGYNKTEDSSPATRKFFFYIQPHKEDE